MSEITFSRPYEWDRSAPVTHAVSHRSTTSSRLPGKAIDGSVTYRISAIGPCADCGGMRRLSSNPHSPHFNQQGRRVDCIGREVAP